MIYIKYAREEMSLSAFYNTDDTRRRVQGKLIDDKANRKQSVIGSILVRDVSERIQGPH